MSPESEFRYMPEIERWIFLALKKVAFVSDKIKVELLLDQCLTRLLEETGVLRFDAIEVVLHDQQQSADVPLNQRIHFVGKYINNHVDAPDIIAVNPQFGEVKMEFYPLLVLGEDNFNRHLKMENINRDQNMWRLKNAGLLKPVTGSSLSRKMNYMNN